MKKTTGRADARPNGVLRTHDSLAATCSNVSGTLFKCFRIQCSSPPEYATKYISNVECGFKTPKLNTFVSIANALQCDANLLLADVLDVTTGQESGLVSKKLLALPPEEQRRILRVLEVMIDESSTK